MIVLNVTGHRQTTLVEKIAASSRNRMGLRVAVYDMLAHALTSTGFEIAAASFCFEYYLHELIHEITYCC